MDNWQTLSSKVLHQNPHLSLREDDVIRPNGKQAPYYVVERPPFSIVIPITEQNETYLVGQYRYSVATYSWEFPMGAVKGKNFLEMAKIELIEETGIRAKTFVDIGSFHIAPGFLHQTAHVFVARGLEIGESMPEAGEILKIKKVSLSSVGEQIANGEILDGPTICAYHYLELYLKK